MGLLALPKIAHSWIREAKGREEQKVNDYATSIDAFLSANLIPPNNPAPPVRVIKAGYPDKSWPVPSKEEAIRLVSYWLDYYGVNPILGLCIVSLESGYYSLADNPVSTAAGLWQFLKGTFNTTSKRMGLPYTYDDYVYNAEVNARMGAWLLKTDSYRHWVVWPKCG